jgi:transcription elongation factor Elf1
MSILDKFDDLATASDNAIENVLIEKFLKENYNINGQYTIKGGIVNVNGSITARNMKLTELTNGMFEFGVVYTYFNCSFCNSLTSLKGAPKKVRGTFYCNNCDSLTSLEGAPEEVGGTFDCSGCTNLTSLEGAPEEVGGMFDCRECMNLTSLEGAPEIVKGTFKCSRCNSLTSLKGAPWEVKGHFNCDECKKLTSLEGAPKTVGGDFYCKGCGVKFTKGHVAAVSNTNKIYLGINIYYI